MVLHVNASRIPHQIHLIRILLIGISGSDQDLLLLLLFDFTAISDDK